VSEVLEHFGLDEIAAQYRFGHSSWKRPDQAEKLDDWIDKHLGEIENAAFSLVSRQRESLTDQS
jgi:hypothetical protein